jgi:hypothetical protein
MAAGAAAVEEEAAEVAVAVAVEEEAAVAVEGAHRR